MNNPVRIFSASLIMMLAIAFLPSCQTNPVAEATTVDQKAYALYGTFVVFEEQAAKIVTTPGTPVGVISAIKAADYKAKPIADSLLVSAREYVAIKSTLDAAPDSNAKLTVATANLQQWVTTATPVINDLVKAVGGK